MEGIVKISLLLVIVTVLNGVSAQEQSQNQTVVFCPLYLFIQNRCPTPSTTTIRTTTRRPPPSGEDDYDTQSEVVEDAEMNNCTLPTITFCPASQVFLSGSRNCSDDEETIRIEWTTLRRLLINPSGQKAAMAVGRNHVEELGNTFEYVAKSIRAPQVEESSTIGVTFIPVGQIIGG